MDSFKQLHLSPVQCCILQTVEDMGSNNEEFFVRHTVSASKRVDAGNRVHVIRVPMSLLLATPLSGAADTLYSMLCTVVNIFILLQYLFIYVCQYTLPIDSDVLCKSEDADADADDAGGAEPAGVSISRRHADILSTVFGIQC